MGRAAPGREGRTGRAGALGSVTGVSVSPLSVCHRVTVPPCHRATAAVAASLWRRSALAGEWPLQTGRRCLTRVSLLCQLTKSVWRLARPNQGLSLQKKNVFPMHLAFLRFNLTAVSVSLGNRSLLPLGHPPGSKREAVAVGGRGAVSSA